MKRRIEVLLEYNGRRGGTCFRHDHNFGRHYRDELEVNFGYKSVKVSLVGERSGSNLEWKYSLSIQGIGQDWMEYISQVFETSSIDEVFSYKVVEKKRYSKRPELSNKTLADIIDEMI